MQEIHILNCGADGKMELCEGVQSSPGPPTSHLCVDNLDAHSEIMRQHHVDDELPKRVGHGEPHQVKMQCGRRLGGAVLALEGQTQLQYAPWQPREEKHEADDEADEVVFGSGPRVHRLLVDDAVPVVAPREDVEIGEREREDGRDNDHGTRGNDVGLLHAPIYDAEVSGFVVDGAGFSEERRATETERSDPDERDPANAAHWRHQRLVTVGFPDCDVMVDAEPHQGVD